MLISEDCLALAELTVDQVDRIAARECLPWIVALELAGHLLETTEGRRRLRRILGEDGPEAAWARDGERCDAMPRATGPETERLIA